MKPIKQTIIARQLKISDGHMSHIIAGSRNCSPALAKELAKITSTSLDVWLFASKKNVTTRQQAFKKKGGISVENRHGTDLQSN